MMRRSYRVYGSFTTAPITATRVVLRDDGVLIFYDNLGDENPGGVIEYPNEVIRRAYANGKWASFECLDFKIKERVGGEEEGVKNDK